jgi:hypothetical protein
MQGKAQNHRDHLFTEEDVPNLRSVGVRRCSEKSTRAWGHFGGLETNTKIFSLYNQMFIP